MSQGHKSCSVWPQWVASVTGWIKAKTQVSSNFLPPFCSLHSHTEEPQGDSSQVHILFPCTDVTCSYSVCQWLSWGLENLKRFNEKNTWIEGLIQISLRLILQHHNTMTVLENMKNDMTFLVTCSIVKEVQCDRICSLWLNYSGNSGIKNGIKPLSHICINHHRMGKMGAISFHKGFHSSRGHGWAGGARGHCHFQGLKRMVSIVQCVDPEPRLQNKVFLFCKMWREKNKPLILKHKSKLLGVLIHIFRRQW